MALAADIGVDLGTANSLIFVRGKGVVLSEPSVVALDSISGQVLAVGEQARRMLGRTPGTITAIRPLRNGVIADYDITEVMLKHLLSRVCGRRMLFRPQIMVCVPSGVTSVEKRAVLEAAMQVGARRTYLIEEPLAAALGAGLDIFGPSGSMIIDIGGGTTDVAVLSLGGIVISESLRIGGDKFDEAIVRYIKQEYSIIIGDRTAEEAKKTGASVGPDDPEQGCELRGRDLVTGLPRTIEVTSRELRAALDEPVMSILDLLRSVLERTPPELSADIMDKGIVFTGGGALLRGLDRLITSQTGVSVHMAEDALSCVATGTGRALEQMERLSDVLMSSARSGS